MATTNIEIQQKTSGGYDSLYPKTSAEQVNLTTARLTTLITPNKDLGALEPYLAIGLNGGYSGTGGHGVGSPNTITFNNVTPRIVYLYSYSSGLCAIFFINKIVGGGGYKSYGYTILNSSVYGLYAKYESGTLSWYSTYNDDTQFNNYQESYGWNAICYGN